jgi:hypothetical protein
MTGHNHDHQVGPTPNCQAHTSKLCINAADPSLSPTPLHGIKQEFHACCLQECLAQQSHALGSNITLSHVCTQAAAAFILQLHICRLAHSPIWSNCLDLDPLDQPQPAHIQLPRCNCNCSQAWSVCKLGRSVCLTAQATQHCTAGNIPQNKRPTEPNKARETPSRHGLYVWANKGTSPICPMRQPQPQPQPQPHQTIHASPHPCPNPQPQPKPQCTPLHTPHPTRSGWTTTTHSRRIQPELHALSTPRHRLDLQCRQNKRLNKLPCVDNTNDHSMPAQCSQVSSHDSRQCTSSYHKPQVLSQVLASTPAWIRFQPASRGRQCTPAWGKYHSEALGFIPSADLAH